MVTKKRELYDVRESSKEGGFPALKCNKQVERLEKHDKTDNKERTEGRGFFNQRFSRRKGAQYEAGLTIAIGATKVNQCD